MGAMAAYFAFVFMNGNPTQHVEKLFKMMSQGMAGKESVAAFDKVYTSVEGNTQHNAYDGDVARSFYNLATEFYEYGWGDSFHFGTRSRSEPHSKCIANSQHFVAQKLRVDNMNKVLDMGCGIGGPLRGVVRATGANVTGVSINEHQIMRAREITSGLSPYMQERCHFEVQDYLGLKGMQEGSFDAAFYMESSLHCEDRTKTFKEAFRMLKPGGRLVAMEYYLLPGWDANNPEHKELMRRHLYGNGAARTPSIEEGLKQITAAGFEIKEHFDLMAELEKVHGVDAWPWWADLQFNWAPDLMPVRARSSLALAPRAANRCTLARCVRAARCDGLGRDVLFGILAVRPIRAPARIVPATICTRGVLACLSLTRARARAASQSISISLSRALVHRHTRGSGSRCPTFLARSPRSGSCPRTCRRYARLAPTASSPASSLPEAPSLASRARRPRAHMLASTTPSNPHPPAARARQAAELMNEGGDGLSGLGKVGAITPQYYVGAIKPL